MHKPDHALQRWVVAQAQALLLRDVEGLAHGLKGLGLLHRVNAQVRLQVQVQIQHVLGIARLVGHNTQHGGGDGVG